MSNNQKLELTWIGKDNQPKLEPRILIEDPEKSYGAKNSENMLIYGDNLLALKALEQDFAGKIKCVCIDPPYNTGSAFVSYDDGLEHSIWLNLMKARLEILYKLLSTHGVIYIHIDEREQAYLKVLCDEIFGRKNFVCTFIWEARSGQGNTVGHIAEFHEYILCYAKDITRVSFKKIENIAKKGNFSDEKGFYTREQLRQWGQGDRKEDRPTMFYSVIASNGAKIYPKRPDGTDGRWRCSKETMATLLRNGDVDFVQDEKGNWQCYKKIREGRVTFSAYGTILTNIGTASTATKELKVLFDGNKVFETPKPENLVHHLLNLIVNKGDIILDSFAGSGTTGAVAHKMNCHWIMIELNEHCQSVVIPRMKKVIDGTDQGGISKAVNWQGGGGFKYYYLAPSLLKKDKHDNWIIDERYNADMLAAAMAKHEGFRYCPDEHIYWKQGRSTEKDYIFITTQFVTVQFLDKIHEEMKPDESLLICCKSFQEACENRYANITIKKIPKMLLGRCEFGKEDYSLNIVNLPEPTPIPSQEGNEEAPEQSNPPIPHLLKGRNGRTKKMRGQRRLFPEKEGNEQQ